MAQSKSCSIYQWLNISAAGLIDKKCSLDTGWTLWLSHTSRASSPSFNKSIYFKIHPIVFSLWSCLLSSILPAIFYNNFVKALFNQFYHDTFITVIRWDSFPWEPKGTVWILIWHIVKWNSSIGGRPGQGVFQQQSHFSHPSRLLLMD